MLEESNAVLMSNRLSEVICRESQRLRLHDEGKPKISDLISVGQLVTVLQGLAGNLSLKN